MAKLSILPFLLLLSIALPVLILAASGDIPTTTDVDCSHRIDESAGGDVEEDSFMPSDDDDMELESDTDEQLDDDEGFFEDNEADESGYIVMPTDNDDDQVEDTESSEADDSDFDHEEEATGDEDSVEGNLGIPVRNVVTQAFFNSIIKNAGSSCKGKKFYTRATFLTAVAKFYPKFGQLKPDAAAKREIAAFFAHVTHETGSLCYVEEIKKATYCDRNAAKQWPCASGKQYYGRGPLQLTWNYNYGAFGKASKLNTLKNPDLVARDRVIAWRASLWFWMKSVRPVLKKGFAATIKAINGGECNGGNRPAVAARVKFYKAYCKRFKVKPGSNLSC